MKNTIKLIVTNLKKYVPINVFRGGQETFYQKIRQAIIDGNRRMYIQGPTGMGKSFIQSTIADAIISGTSIKVLLLVPKITLLSQMRREFVKFAKHIIIGLVGGGSKDYSKQVTVMTYQSFLRKKQHEIAQYSVLLLDEAHKALGEKTRAKIDAQAHAIVIGFTATSYYNENKNLKEWLGLEVHRVTIPEAVKVRMISGIQFIVGKVRIEIVDRTQGENKKAYEKRVASEIIRQGGNIAAARIYKKLFSGMGIRFIMFTLTVEQGYDLVKELRNNDIKAEIIHGDMKIKEREQLFERFAQDKFKVLVGIDVIKEGFDDPGVHGSLFAYPIGSLLGLEQGGGRSTRINELIPDKIAYIIQLMFNGRNQVWYSDILEGETIVLPPKERPNNPESRLISKNALKDVSDEVIESVAVETDEVLKLVSGYKENYEYKEAPEGWMTSSQISQLPNVQGSHSMITTLAQSYYGKNSDWCCDYRTRTQIAKHYHPDLVKIIKRLCARVEFAPQGWMTANQIRQFPDVQGDEIKIGIQAESYRNEHSDWFCDYRVSTITCEHYHPDLVKILKGLCARVEFAPKGWMTAKTISEIPGIQGGSVKVKSLAESYRNEHSDWFCDYRVSSITCEHYHPDLVKILKGLCVPKEEAPEGWMTANHIVGLPNVQGNDTGVKALAESYRDEHSDWFRLYWKRTRMTEHYHPDLVKIIKKLKKKPKK